MWGLRASPANFLRSQDPSRTRSLLWRHSGVLGVRDPSRVLPELRHRVKQETLNWLADNPFYTKQLAFYAGRQQWAATIKDVARELA